MVKSETDIINAINNHIAQYRLIVKDQAYVGYDFLDDIIANLCVCYFYFIDPIAEKQLPAAINNVDMFASFKTAFSRYLKHKGVDKDYLKSLNRDGLYQYFVKCLVAKLTDDKKIEFCKNISLITVDETQGQVVFSKVEKVYEAYGKDSFAAKNIIPDDYFGEEDFVFEEHHHEDSIEDCLLQNTGGDRARRNLEDIKNKIEELYNGLKAIDALHDNVGDIQAGKYVWQLQLNFGQWQRIKEVCEQPEVKERISVWGGCSDSNKYDKEIAAMLLIYVGEWNKRVWNGNNAESRNIGEIISSNVARKIVETQKVLHVEKGEESQQSRWLDALKVQGGFPLWYIYNNRNETGNHYMYMFEYFLVNNDCEMDWENQMPQNQSYRLSYDMDDSIADYARTVSRRQFCFDDSDSINQEGGVTFKELKVVLSNLANNKFNYNWHVSRIGQLSSVNLQISFRDERDLVSSSDERKYAVQETRLKYWLGQEDVKLPESFLISFTQPKTQKTLKTICFDRCTDGSWIPRASNQHRFLVPFENESQISISIDGKVVTDNIYTKNKGEYQLMYSGDNIYWMNNSLSRKKAYFACLIFNVDKYAQTPGLERLSGGYGWVKSEDNHTILLTDNSGRKILIHNTKDSLIVTPIDATATETHVTFLESKNNVVDNQYYRVVLPRDPNNQEEGDESAESSIMIPSSHIIKCKTQLYCYLYNQNSRKDVPTNEVSLTEVEESYNFDALPLGYHKFVFSYEAKQQSDSYFVLPEGFDIQTLENGSGLRLLGLKEDMQAYILEDSELVVKNGKLQFDINKHREKYYTLCLKLNDFELQIPIIPPYEQSIYIPQDPNRVIPLPAFWFIRKYENKVSYDIPADLEGLTTTDFLREIRSEVNFRSLNSNEGTYFVEQDVLRDKEQYSFYYFNGNNERRLSITEEGKLILDDEESWAGKRGIIIQSYEDKKLKPTYYHSIKKLNGYLSITAREYLNKLGCELKLDGTRPNGWKGVVNDYCKTNRGKSDLLDTLLYEFGLAGDNISIDSISQRVCNEIEIYDQGDSGYQYNRKKKDWSQEYLDALLFALEHRIRFDVVLGKGFAFESGTKWKKEFLQQILCKYFNYCDTNNVKIVYQGLWRLANEYKFDWIWLWSMMKGDEHYIRLLQERVTEPKMKSKMQMLLQQLLKATGYNNRRHADSRIKDMLRLMFAPENCLTRNGYTLGEAYNVFRNNIDIDIQNIQNLLILK